METQGKRRKKQSKKSQKHGKERKGKRESVTRMGENGKSFGRKDISAQIRRKS
jgi:hypothetical protein